MFALYLSQTLLYPVTGRSRRMDNVDKLSPDECVCLCWSATTVLVAWRRGDEGALGKALQIRSNYSSPPPFALTGSLLPLLLRVTPVL